MVVNVSMPVSLPDLKAFKIVCHHSNTSWALDIPSPLSLTNSPLSF